MSNPKRTKWLNVAHARFLKRYEEGYIWNDIRMIKDMFYLAGRRRYRAEGCKRQGTDSKEDL